MLFLVSALSTGSMGVILSTMGYGLLFSGGDLPNQLVSRLTRTEQILILIEGLVLAFYLISKYRSKDQGEDSVRLLITGDLRFLFWGGIVSVGFIFPTVLEYLYSHFPQYPGLLFATGALLLAGGFFLRLGLLASGIKEQLPMHKLIEMKMNMSALQRGK
jgi:formate-dependent nitrite reductase membrane component NrfD